MIPTYANEAAFPRNETYKTPDDLKDKILLPEQWGLSKLEYFAAAAMQSIIAKIPLHDSEGEHGIPCTRVDTARIYQGVAESAVGYALALIDELKKK